MPEEERLRLVAIQDRIALISSWTKDLGEAAFVADLMLCDAVALSLLVIGETSRRLLETTRDQAPEIPWSALISLRNRMAHGYETVDHSLVWQIVSGDLPALKLAVAKLLEAATRP